MNILKKIRNYRERKRDLQRLRNYAGVTATLKRLADSGMLYWEPKQRRMMIAEPLALMMMQTAEGWQNFIQNLYLWTYADECNRAWTDYLQREELAAVRRAATKLSPTTTQLTRQEIDRIRRARRSEIAQSDLQPPRVEPFEFFIIPDTTEPSPAPIAVGWFDPETDRQDLAAWSDVSAALIHPNN